ncbi:uncharacterized protein [Aegilops tauschii subsp. strangulata]|uniref:uncharacterized protein n=1 Tax=Aegilops tauschii subsp. strangulata TaxID=200361 RepID=UPI003CC84D1E
MTTVVLRLGDGGAIDGEDDGSGGLEDGEYVVCSSVAEGHEAPCVRAPCCRCQTITNERDLNSLSFRFQEARTTRPTAAATATCIGRPEHDAGEETTRMGRSGGPPPPPSNFSAHLHHPNPVPSRTAMAPVMRVGLSRPDQSSTAAAPSVVASASSRPTPARHGGTPTTPFPASQESASAMDAEASVGHTTGMSGNVGQTGAPTKRRAARSATKEEQGDSMEWTDEYVQIVCSLMAEQVGQGNRPNTHLNPLGYNTVSERFYQMTGISLSKTQLKNKWDKLKGDWSCWNKLMRKQTGTGWDSSKGVIVMDNEWWKKARKDIPGCGKFRKKPLQNLEHLSKMFW